MWVRVFKAVKLLKPTGEIKENSRRHTKKLF
jgi:hypothetical protein